MGKRFWHWFWGHSFYPRHLDGTERCNCGAVLTRRSRDPNTCQQDVAEKAKDVDKEATT